MGTKNIASTNICLHNTLFNVVQYTRNSLHITSDDLCPFHCVIMRKLILCLHLRLAVRGSVQRVRVRAVAIISKLAGHPPSPSLGSLVLVRRGRREFPPVSLFVSVG